MEAASHYSRRMPATCPPLSPLTLHCLLLTSDLPPWSTCLPPQVAHNLNPVQFWSCSHNGRQKLPPRHESGQRSGPYETQGHGCKQGGVREVGRAWCEGKGQAGEC